MAVDLLPVWVRLVALADVGLAVGVVASHAVVGLWTEFAALDAAAGGGRGAGVVLRGWLGGWRCDGFVQV